MLGPPGLVAPPCWVGAAGQGGHARQSVSARRTKLSAFLFLLSFVVLQAKATHPDRFTDPDEKAHAHELFTAVGTAFQVLSDRKHTGASPSLAPDQSRQLARVSETLNKDRPSVVRTVN